MPPEQALRRIQRDMDANPPLNVILAARSRGQDEDDLRRLTLTAALQREFQTIATRAIRGELRLVPYEPGYKPDESELCWIDLALVQDALNVVRRISNFQALVIFAQEKEFIDALRFYVLYARVAGRTGIVFFRKDTEKLELGRGGTFGAIFRRGQYDRIEENVFLFDRNIDCWSDGQYMFIRNVTNFERIFRYYEQLQVNARETVTAVLRRIPIANADAFMEACTTQVRFMTKLAVIASKPYLGQIGMPDIRRAIEEHNLQVEIINENGQESLRFDPDPARRWILLKLLDDDYLNSVMTHLRYEVNSKISRGAPER
jgi:hypothetical protein